MKTKAAVLVEGGKPLEIMELEVPPLKPGQILVEISYSGVCHTQLLEAGGHRGPDSFLPHCLGHEGVGHVLEVGPNVTRASVGNTVILSWIKANGIDGGPVRYKADRTTVNAGPIATFMTTAVISEDRVSPLSDDRIPLERAAMLGCAVPTGFGLIFNTLSGHQGHSVVVFGLGGIGLCAVAAAAAVGCHPVVAVDPRADRRKAARALGATRDHEGGAEATANLRAIVPGGFDLAVEATGRPDVMSQALAVVRPRGGCAAVAGNARFGETLAIDPRELNLGKRLLGTWGGDTDPDRDFPKFTRLIGERRIDLGPLSADAYPLERINDALNDLASGKVIRPMIAMAE